MPYLRAFDAYGVALKYGKECDFVESYGVCQWGLGISAGTDEGLKTMMRMSGMSDRWEEVRAELYGQSSEQKFSKWEAYTTPNRDFLSSRGQWGVPCIRYGDSVIFGQDKLWAIKMLLSREQQREEKSHSAVFHVHTHDCTNNSQHVTSVNQDAIIAAIEKYCGR